MKSFGSILALMVNTACAESDVTWTSMGSFSLKNAAFPSLTSFHDSDPFLLMSTFSGSPIGKGKVFIVPDVEAAIKNETVSNLETN